MMLIRLCGGLLLFIAAMQLEAETYRVTFTGTWNENDISSAFPFNAHFTDLVGGTHISGSPFWESGVLATKGIETVAEQGDEFFLLQEVNAAIQASTADAFIQVGSIFNFPGSSTMIFNIFQDKPEVTLISMIAPSPDWFVGVSGLSLYGQNGWVDSITVDLIPWEAGTEDGAAFSLSNPASNPQEVIAILTNSPFIGSPVIGQITFDRVPRPVYDPAYDVNDDGSVDVLDLLLMNQKVLLEVPN